jgi:hypothetical protein
MINMEVMDYRNLGKTEFATVLGISKGAITKAVNQGRILVNPDTDKIDPAHPRNYRYIETVIDRGVGIGLDPRFKAAMDDDFNDPEVRRRKKKLEALPKRSKAKMVYEEVAARLGPDVNIETEAGENLFDELMKQGLLQPGEQLKVAQTTLANLKIAKEMDDLVVRSMVQNCFARLSGIIASRLLCLGQRSAKQLCSLFNDVSPEKEIAVQKVLDDEVAGAVTAIQKEIRDATDW